MKGQPPNNGQNVHPQLVIIRRFHCNTCMFVFYLTSPSSSRVALIRTTPENVGITDRTVWQLNSVILSSSTIADTVPCLTHRAHVASELPALLARVQNSMKN